MFIDSHAHITTELLAPHAEELIQRACAAQVTHIINICTDMPSLLQGMALQQKYPTIVFNAAATTPHDVEKEGEEVFPMIADHAREGALIAIGETGLDYYNAVAEREVQKEFLRRYLHLALECHLPVVIHCRNAFSDLFPILDAEYRVNGELAPGVLHCFTGTQAEAEAVLKRGWYLSLSGIVTFKKSQELREIAKTIPLHRLLLETDAPFLAPQRHRGKINEPAFISETAQCLAEVHQISLQELAAATRQNALDLFKLQM